MANPNPLTQWLGVAWYFRLVRFDSVRFGFFVCWFLPSCLNTYYIPIYMIYLFPRYGKGVEVVRVRSSWVRGSFGPR